MLISTELKLLIERFLVKPNKILSLNSINRTIENIKFDLSLPNDSKIYISELLELGIVDIVGKNHYQLSPSALIEVNGKLISVNMPLELLQPYILKELIYKTVFSLDVKYERQIKNQLKIPIVKVRTISLLRKIPPLDIIVSNFYKKEVLDINGYNYFNKRNQWESDFSKDLKGCYRAGNELFYDKLIRVSKENWFLIPDQSTDPDAFSIAVLYARTLNKLSLNLEYNSNSKELRCSNYFFPSLIKRILNLNACFDSTSIITDKNHTIYKDIELPFYKVLNHIFMNQIKII
jgi:hypothetical protein